MPTALWADGVSEPGDPFYPAFHFAPREGWMNDPNGLVYFRDTWHLFYQYFNPQQVDGMQWGHATSPDLIHWTEHAPALQPDAHGQIWSGSAVVDGQDSSGRFGGQAGVVAAFTYWDPADGWQSQGMAYSADAMHFDLEPANPVIAQLRHLEGHPPDKAFRDPKVFWHEPTRRWVMVVAGGKLRFFTSSNLRDWRFETLQPEIETECPDLFALPLDGDPANLKWVLSGGGRWYQVGGFDGRRFTPETDRIVLGAGPDFYATQSWSDAPDGRRVLISWLFGWNYDSGPRGGAIANPFPTGARAGGCQSVPAEARLVSTTDGPRLQLTPVPELAHLREAPSDHSLVLEGEGWVVLADTGRAFDIELRTPQAPTGELRLRVPAKGETYLSFGYDVETGAYFIDRTRDLCDAPEAYVQRYNTERPMAFRDQALNLRVLIDHNSIEVFADEGQTLLSAILHLPPEAGGLALATGAGQTQAVQASVYPMGKAVVS